MQVFPAQDPVYLNARADECVAIALDRGGRIVSHRGGVYSVIGYYLACQAGERVVCYVLRAQPTMDGAARKINTSVPASPRGG